MFGLGTQELIIVAVVILLLFGANKIPELMRGLGRGAGEFKAGLEDSKKMLKESLDATPSSSEKRDEETVTR